MGFDWPDVEGPFQKVEEEMAELRAAMEAADARAIEAELGDALFALVNLARHLGVDPERAIHGTVERFSARFEHLEAALAARGLAPVDAAPDELEALWTQAKRALG